MTISIDANVLAALWNPRDSTSTLATAALQSARRRGPLVVSAPVYAELLAGPLRTDEAVDEFLSGTGIAVDWQVDEAMWRTAGRAYRAYAARRRANKDHAPRRILADFVIGAQAHHKGYALLTIDARLYRVSFPRLAVIQL